MSCGHGVRAAIATVVVVTLTGCSGVPRHEPPPARLPPLLSAFDISGRLSVKHQTNAAAANFRWHHDAVDNEIELLSPIGQTIAQISGDATGVRLLAADGRTASAGDWQSLTEQVLHAPLPVEGLVFWIQGVPRPASVYAIESDSDGLPGVLRQDGWTIVYQSYTGNAVSATPRPVKMTLSYPDIEVRIVVDTWQ